jgi:3-hydroxyacyl-[acyl-carrier-protein] dehydratase
VLNKTFTKRDFAMAVKTLIPHRDPMVMIDELVYADRCQSVSRFTIKENNVFMSRGRFGEPGLIENIAQTAAAGSGFNRQREGKPNPVGYLGGLRNLRIDALPMANSELTTTVLVDNEIMGMTVVTGKIVCDGRIIVECEMKFMIANP